MNSIPLSAKNVTLGIVIVLGIVTGTALLTKSLTSTRCITSDGLPCDPPFDYGRPTGTRPRPDPIIPTSTEPVVPTSTIPDVTTSGSYAPGLETIEAWQKMQNAGVDYPPPKRVTVTVPVDWQKPVKAPLSALRLDAQSQAQRTIIEGPYLRGTVPSGAFAGTHIYTVISPCDGMCMTENIVDTYLVLPSGESIDLYDGASVLNYGNTQDGTPLTDVLHLPTADGSNNPIDYVLSRPTLANIQTLANGRQVGVDPDSQIYNLGRTIAAVSADCWKYSCKGYETFATTKEGNTILRRATSAAEETKVIITEDGTLHRVYSTLPVDAVETNMGRAVMGYKAFVWDEAHANKNSFVYSYNLGCGGVASDVIITENNIREKDLIIIGHTTSGDALYGVKDFSLLTETQKAYDNWFAYGENGEKPSYQEFLKRYPVPFFIWKNAFGENVRFVLADSVVPAECGKPVIYLYPTKPTNVHVRLDPSIHVSVSEPTYPTAGWSAQATPEGKLTVDGKPYSSLFWEGTGVVYQTPSTGFILKEGEVDSQLHKLLTRYGLNTQESKDFREFWVPRMTGAPYYRVSFITGTEWNQAAPLYVTPAPQSILRVFMDWEKLSKPVEIREPVVSPFKRVGFALVEWGGILR